MMVGHHSSFTLAFVNPKTLNNVAKGFLMEEERKVPSCGANSLVRWLVGNGKEKRNYDYTIGHILGLVGSGNENGKY